MRLQPRDAAVAAQKVNDHGRHVFIYNNLLTNQVIYSLTKSMHNKDALKQLAYFGKKSVPAKIRKDVWAPLAAVTFPHSNQGLDAFRKLREYRRLRDVTWDREAEHMPLEKKRRKRALMDQKATSIADLAAILHKQEGFGRESKAEADRIKQEHDAKVAEEQKQVEAELKNLAERTQRGDIAKIEARIQDVMLEMQGSDSSDSTNLDKNQKEKIAHKLLQLRQLKNSLKQAHEASQNNTIATLAHEKVNRRAIDRAVRGLAPKSVLTSQPPASSSGSGSDSSSSSSSSSNPPAIPRFGRRRLLVSTPKPVPYFSMAGVQIAWSNVLDTEFAASWPAAVQHEHMGFTRHTARDPREGAYTEVRVVQGSPAWKEAERQRRIEEEERKVEERKRERRERRENKARTFA